MSAGNDETAEQIAETTAEKPGKDETSFTVERLQSESEDFLGYPGHVVAGAYAGVDPQKKVALETARKRCEQWLKAAEERDPAQTEDDEEQA